MSYTIHHTTGIIIGIRNRGEANRVYTILTRDLGVIRTTAQSSRKETSKMRYGLQLLDYSKFDCIYGRDFWRLVGVAPETSGIAFIQPPALWAMWNNIARLIERLVPFDEAHPELFDVVADAHYWAQTTTVTTEQIYALEKIIVIRILYELGYWHEEDNADYIKQPLSHIVSQLDDGILKELTRTINNSLQSTQL